MLDLASVAAQSDSIVSQMTLRRRRRQDAVARARALVAVAPQTWRASLPRLRAQPSSFLVAFSEEPPGTASPAPAPPERYTVVATDGSQVVPDRHDGLEGCGLLQIGRVRLSYGGSERAQLGAITETFFEPDSEGEEGHPMATLAWRRQVREMEELATLSVETNADMALTDGSLIAWTLAEDQPASSERREAREALLRALGRCQATRVPVVGYISAPASRDVVNGLALLDASDLRPATDGDLFASLLAPGERSPLFSARGRNTGFPHVLRHYGEHWICFFYLQVGAEIARVELPAWAADDPPLVERVHALCLDQARKGRGYPVALAEAHECAVIRSTDRQAFLNLLTRASVRAGAPVLSTHKALAKRTRAV